MHTLMFLMALSIAIAVHELGHLLAARWRGISVDVFSVGVGPALWSHTDSRGTKWQIAPIPIGGYIEPNKKSMKHATPWSHIVMTFAGPLFSVLFAIPIFTILILMSAQLGELSWLSAFASATEHTFQVLMIALERVGHLLSGGVPLTELSGPVGIVDRGAEEVAAGLEPLLLYVAYLTIGLGVFNLLPIPPLDGGRILISGIELFVGPKYIKWVQIPLMVAGGLSILGLMVYITYQDIASLF